MKHIKSSVYLPNEILLAETLADGLKDRKSFSFYLKCAKKYPADFLLETLNDVAAIPDHMVRTTRARLFTDRVTKSSLNSNDITWD